MRKTELQDCFSFLSQNLNPKVAKQILATSGRGGTSAARDYISANCLLSEAIKAGVDLSSVNDQTELWNALHPATRFRLKSYTPALAARYDELKEAQQKACFEDHDWVATTKLNGVRGWLICTPDGKVHLYSRNYSDKDCSLLEYWNNIYQAVAPHDDIYAIDVEVMFEPGVNISSQLESLGLETDSQLEAMVALLHTYPESACEIQSKFKQMYNKDLISLNVIHPLYFKGKNYVNRTLGEGLDVYDECVAYGKSLGLNVKAIDMCNGSRVEKETFLDSILNNGGEGIVFHYRKGQYCTSENRSKTCFIKLKRSVSSTMAGVGMGDQIDGFVSGFKMGSNGTSNEGLISALEFSIYVNDNGRFYPHTIAVCPNVDLETKRLITLNDASGSYPQEWIDSNGVPHWVSLNPEFDNLVAELDGQSISNIAMRLTHPRIIMWRPERDPNGCCYSKEFLDANLDKNLK